MSKEYIGKVCPYCKTPLVEGDAVVFCSVCDMPHHLSCWQDNQGCTTFGCTGSIQEIINADAAAVAAPAPTYAPPANPAPAYGAPGFTPPANPNPAPAYGAPGFTPPANPNPAPAYGAPGFTPPANPNPAPAYGAPGRPAPAYGNPAPAYAAPQPAAPAAPAEKPIETLIQQTDVLFTEGVPVALENCAIILDRTKDKVFARCTFRSLTDKPIQAMLVEVTCQDIWGSDMGEPITFQYLDLKTKRDSKFGQATPIELESKDARKLKVLVKKVLFADGDILTGGDKQFKMAAPVLLSQHLKSDELAAEYARETNPKAQYVPVDAQFGWRCACGSMNLGTESTCHTCESDKAGLLALLDPEQLRTTMLAFQEEQRIAAEKALAEKRAAEEKARQERIAAEEKARAEEAERIRIAEEQIRLENERKEQERQAALKARKEKRRKVTKIVLIVLGALLGIALILGTIFYGIPYLRYQSACTAMEQGDYDSAYQTFTALGDFMESPTMATTALYQKGKAALENKQYDEAIEIFTALGNYADCPTLLNTAQIEKENAIKEAKYQEGLKAITDKKYDEAIKIFTELGDYSDSAQKLEEAIRFKENAALEAQYQEGMKALEAREYDKAIEIFTALGDYADSADKVKESQQRKEDSAKQLRYDEGVAAMQNKEYDKAIAIFTELGDFADSKAKITEVENMISEDKYQEGLKALEAKNYDEAIKIFTELGDYSDSKTKLKEAKDSRDAAKYDEGVAAMKSGNLEKAISIFEELGNYKDCRSKLTDAKYSLANKYFSSGNYKQAATLYSQISGHKDSATKLTESMYAYVVAHKSSSDKTTFEYLKKLKSQNYKDTVSIYNSLYKWKASGAINNLQCVFTISGGGPGDTINLTYSVRYPNGKTSSGSANGKTGGSTVSVDCSGASGASGTLTVKLYNADTGELLCTVSKSVS